MEMACTHCGARAPAGTQPTPGDMLFCVFCGGIAVWDDDTGWRNMTAEEHRERMAMPSYLEAVEHTMVVREYVEKDRDTMARVITRRLRGCVYPWLNPDQVATDLADSLIRSGFHAAHQEEPDGD